MKYLIILFILLLSSSAWANPKVILITLDGVRWQEIYNGSDRFRDNGEHLTPQQLVPNLYNSFVSQGMAFGKSSKMIASGPNHISLPGYLEIVRGHPSTDCQTNYCNPIIDRSFFAPFNRSAVFSSWNTIHKTLPNTSIIYTDIGINYRLDFLTQLSAISYLETHEGTDFLWVSLGDTDEFAHRNSYADYIQSLKNADNFIGYLVSNYPGSDFVITTDHGRSIDFKDHGSDKGSEMVWLMMKGPDVPYMGMVKAKPISLSNVYPTILYFQSGIHTTEDLFAKVN